MGYFIAPASVPLLLSIAIARGEVSSVLTSPWRFPIWMMAANMMLAFSLNFVGIMVIKRMSAVAYVLSGVCKDVVLVTIGGVMWAEQITKQQIFGYSIALTGLAYYNLASKLRPAPKVMKDSNLEPLQDDDDDLGQVVEFIQRETKSEGL